MANKTIFITRTKNEKDLVEPNFKRLIAAVLDGDIKEEDIYVVSDFGDYNHKVELLGGRVATVHIIEDENPISRTSINTALDKIKTDGKVPVNFLVCSKEIKVSAKNIKDLIEKIKEDKKEDKRLLVVGYKFHLKDEKLNNELQAYYGNKNLIAYQVPLNTCAIWNYYLFDKYVSKFDEITEVNPFPRLSVAIDGECIQTKYQGMEDGLAIAKAASLKKLKICFKLLDKPLLWEIDSSDSEVRRHREKLARKEIVMRNFMAIRDYSIRDLKNAKLV